MQMSHCFPLYVLNRASRGYLAFHLDKCGSLLLRMVTNPSYFDKIEEKKNHDYDSTLLLMKHVFGIPSFLCHDFNVDKQWSLKGYVTFVKSIEETIVKCLLVDI